MRRYMFLFIISLFTLNGCAILWFGAGTGIGITGYKYYKGELETKYYANYIKVYNASKLALKNLNITIEKQYKDSIEGYLEGYRLNGSKVKIKVKNIGNYVIVKIRVGLLGDLEASKLIKSKIDAYVGQKGK